MRDGEGAEEGDRRYVRIRLSCVERVGGRGEEDEVVVVVMMRLL